MTNETKRPTVREINDHLGYGRYAYVYGEDGNFRMRITRARTRKGVLEGRKLDFSDCSWTVIEPTDKVVLSRY